MISNQIGSEIFRHFPTYRRGVIVARRVTNGAHTTELRTLLEKAVGTAAAIPTDDDRRVTDWIDAFRLLGLNPNKFAPAHRALLRRSKKAAENPFPPFPDLVSIMTIISLTHFLPVGGDDLDQTDSNLNLRLASGAEMFTPLGEPATQEHPDPGEIIFVTGQNQVMCRRWVWRNSHTTRITETTSTISMNFDGLGENSEERVLKARDEAAELLTNYCGAKVEKFMLTPSNPTLVTA